MLNWTGIQIKNVTEEDSVSLKYTKFKDVETAIGIQNSTGIKISNCLFKNSYIEGIDILDSQNCTIENSLFYNNYKSVTIRSEENICCDNNIKNNIFKKGQNAIIMSTNKYGKITRNVIENNHFEDSEMAIFLSNTNKNFTGNNSVISNVIYSTKQDNTISNTGIYLQADSIRIDNNIFWRLGNVIEFKDNIYCEIKNNTFFENNLCLKDITTLKNTVITDNTFSQNITISVFSRYNNALFERNNFLLHKSVKPTFINNLASNINIKNNYWGTTNNIIIENAIIDYNDDTNLGKIIYLPSLSSHNIEAPISPPQKVTKQFTGNGVLVSWESNKENDLNSYNIYYDIFNIDRST